MFVEVTRLLIVLLSTAGGYAVGGGSFTRNLSVTTSHGPLIGAALGAFLGYVLGGMSGRLIQTTLGRVDKRLEATPAPSAFVGMIGALVLGGIAAIVSVAAPVLVPHHLGWIVYTLAVWIGGYSGYHIASRKSDSLLAMAGLSTRPLTRTSPYSHNLGSDASLVDTSAIIDGRLFALAQAGLLSGALLVPVFVLDELQGIADAQDPMRRRRGRRGLDLLDAIQKIPGITVDVVEEDAPETTEVDAKLVALCKRLRVGLITVDVPLQRVAELQGIRCLNLDQLTDLLRVVHVPGEQLRVLIAKEGREPGQGVGYLDDGTMVVVADAADRVGSAVEVRIANTMQTSVGRMIFGTVDAESGAHPNGGVAATGVDAERH